MALTILPLIFIIFFSSDNVIVEIKLTIVCLGLKFKFLIIFFPTDGVTDKKTQSELSIIYWLLLLIVIFLNFFFNLKEIWLFLFEIKIFLNLIFDLQIPSITDEAILPVPINPNLTVYIY